MATLQQQRRELQRKAEQYQRQARKQLENLLAPGRGNGRWMDPYGTSQSFTAAGFGLSAPAQNSAAETFRFGQSITDADVKRFIESGGGNPYIGALRELDARSKERKRNNRKLGRTGRGVIQAAEQNAQTAIQQLFADAQARQDEANAANLYRYDYGLGNLEALRDRNQERVQNFGIAAREDLNERFDQNLANVTASLSDRGLGNSTILDSFNARNARDRERELQRLSEMVDDRAARYDTSDTANAVSFAERRNDVAPDMGQLLQLAQMYGASGAVDGAAGVPATSGASSGGRGMREEESAIPLQFGMNLPYATSPWNASRIAGSVQGAYPSLERMMQPTQGMGPIQSNRYPTRRDYSQLDNQQESLPRRGMVTQQPYQQIDLTRLRQSQSARNGPFYGQGMAAPVRPIPQSEINQFNDVIWQNRQGGSRSVPLSIRLPY